MIIELDANTKQGNRFCPLLGTYEPCMGTACTWFTEIPPLPYEQPRKSIRGNCAITCLAAMRDR